MSEPGRPDGSAAGTRPDPRSIALFDGIPGVLWEAYGNPDQAQQRIDFVSPSVEIMLGYSVEEWLNTPNFWLSIVHPDDRERAARVAADAFARGETHTNQFRWLAKDGRTLWVESHSTVIHDDNGVPVGMRGVTLDITARKQSEEELRQHLEDLSRMQRVSTRLMQAGNFSDLLHDILAAAIEITGARMGNIQLLDGDSLRVAVHQGLPDAVVRFFDSGQTRAACYAALDRGERVIVDDVATSPIFVGTPSLDVLRAAGVRAVQSTPLISRSGRMLGMFSTHYDYAPARPGDRALRLLDILARQAADLIESKQADQVLRARESQLQRLISETPFMLTRCSRDLRYTFVSRAYADMVGRKPAEIEGRPIVEVMGDEGFATIRPFVDAVLAGSRVEYDNDVTFTGVGPRSLHVVYVPDRDDDGKVIGWIASILDVTDEKQASDARALVSSIVETSYDAIVTKNLDGIITSWNAAAEGLFGYPANEIIGRSIRVLIPPERQSEEDDILARLRRGERVEHFETVRIAKDGRRLNVSVTISPLRNAAGTVIGASKIARDVSAIRAAEAERLRLVQEASRLKDEFLASLSHELRTPLNAVLGYARMLSAGIVSADKQPRAIETIERNATSLTQIVEDVLDVSRIISGKIRLNVQPVDFPQIVENAVEAVLPAADAKGVRVETVLDPHAPVSGDPERLQQVLWNLFSNAVKFTSRGGKVQIRLERVNSHVQLSVADTGVGISPEFLPHVFERFRQADASITRERGGLGLGLSISRQLAEMHGGTIEAASGGLGQGSTFTLKLPLMIVHAISGEAGEPGHHRTGPDAKEIALGDLLGVHVLAVDDDADALVLVAELLGAAGARVSTAASAEEALRMIEVDPPQVLVTDVGMPRMDGFELIHRIRGHQNPVVRRVPAAALTAYARSDDRVKALRAGFQIHLAKPIDPTELVTSVAALARRFAPEAEA
jgi:PAS domain S-box-containing protein